MKKYLLVILALLLCRFAPAQIDPENTIVNTSYEKGEIKRGERIGVWEYFDEPGELALKYDYKKEEMLFLDKDTSAYVVKHNNEWVSLHPDSPPRFIGSMKGFYKNMNVRIQFSPSMIRSLKCGIMYVKFEIGKNGVLQNVDVLNTLDSNINNQIVYALEKFNFKWLPAKVEAKNCAAQFLLPVKFKILIGGREIASSNEAENIIAQTTLATPLPVLTIEYAARDKKENDKQKELDSLLETNNFRYNENVKYYFNEEGSLADSSSAYTYKLYSYDNKTGNAGHELEYYLEGKFSSEKYYEDLSNKKSLKNEKKYFDNGKVKADLNYNNEKLNGELTSWYESGELKRRDIFKDGKLVNGNCYTKEGKDTNYFNWEVMPEFPGGEQKLVYYLRHAIRYPVEARENGIEGIVYIKFVVNTDGNVSDLVILRAKDPSLELETIRVIKSMPKWIPGMQDGEKVRVTYNLPINYKLQ